ncbi:MAG: hypothetical protein MPK06_07600 [Alphaproteobacteria bacterium]|nr:hypothetical protein [Alphaproteobacteria bacterium]MDA8006378.1 hypothetical protein [Alphaproteobacteria bacterium]MDA8013773.1 hypothetical protein [Alphaproteobacteria bacterium]
MTMKGLIGERLLALVGVNYRLVMMLAQASDASRRVRASPQKIKKELINNLLTPLIV